MSKTLISIEDAKAWTKAYQDNMPKRSAKAFLISCGTIVDILKEMKVLQDNGKGDFSLNNVEDSSIRAYMAINSEKTDENRQTLVMVGTKKDATGVERDMVEGEKNAPFNKEDVTGSGAFDFTGLCPKYCDDNSPLNH